MLTERRIVDNRVFLLGLDGLYRHAMMEHERSELLVCARRVAKTLRVAAEEVAVEGYYAEDEALTEYFRLLRVLQQVDSRRASEVGAMQEFHRLRAVTAAPLYGRAVGEDKLLPVGRDPLSQALRDMAPDWTVARLTSAAHEIALRTDDISLVGLASRIRDPVVLAAVRESVVLYAEYVVLGIPPPPEYVWAVEGTLAGLASRFISAFNALFGEELPSPQPSQAERYWEACANNQILGRCVRLGYIDSVTPIRHYHWGICRNGDGDLGVQEFWKTFVWTTSSYRCVLGPDGRGANFGTQGHEGSSRAS